MQGAVDSKPGRSAADGNPVFDRRFALAAGFLLAAICAALWLTAWQSRGWISAWPRSPDDAYYYLVIARNVAAGLGFSVDQISLTNGFQPLWLATLVPVAWLVGDHSATFLGVVQGLTVLFFVVATAALCGLVRARVGLVPALVAGLVVLLPRFQNVIASGMESGLVVLVLVALVIEAVASGSLVRPEPAWRDARTGVLLGGLMLARLDTVFVALAVAAGLALRGLAHGEGSFFTRLTRVARKELSVFWPAVLLVSPYLAWNRIVFGHVMPISGALKNAFPVPGFAPEQLRIEYVGLLVIAIAAAVLERARGRRDDPLIQVLGVVTVGLVIHTLNTVVFMRWAVFAWHFAAAIPIGAIGAALLARDAAVKLPRGALMLLLGCAATFLVFAHSYSIWRLSRTFTVAGREAGLWVAQNLPQDAILGMKDSGAFSFFSERRVMNLDGVVNSLEFQRALCSGELERFIRERGVAYIVQHSVPPQVRIGAYETFRQAYPCHLAGGRAGELILRRDLEVFRGAPYASDAGRLDQLFIWRIEPAP